MEPADTAQWRGSRGLESLEIHICYVFGLVGDTWGPDGTMRETFLKGHLRTVAQCDTLHQTGVSLVPALRIYM